MLVTPRVGKMFRKWAGSECEFQTASKDGEALNFCRPLMHDGAVGAVCCRGDGPVAMEQCRAQQARRSARPDGGSQAQPPARARANPKVRPPPPPLDMVSVAFFVSFEPVRVPLVCYVLGPTSALPCTLPRFFGIRLVPRVWNLRTIWILIDFGPFSSFPLHANVRSFYPHGWPLVVPVCEILYPVVLTLGMSFVFRFPFFFPKLRPPFCER